MRPQLPCLLVLSALLAGAASPAAADRLVRKDGTIIEGTVVQEGETYRVLSRFGEATVPVADVTAWEKGPSLETQWRDRVAALAPGDLAGRVALARWLQENGLADEARGVAEQVAREDPENAEAHELLGHVRHRGTWMTPDDAQRAQGLIERGGRWYTPQEWALLDGAAKEQAQLADRKLAATRASGQASDAVRMMLAPDEAVRVEGERRLTALAAETQNPAFRQLVPQVKAFAAASERLRSALQGPTTVESADLLMECRIQLAKLKRPIQTFETSLASNLSSAPVKLQLPEVEVISVGTTVKVPVR